MQSISINNILVTYLKIAPNESSNLRDGTINENLLTTYTKTSIILLADKFYASNNLCILCS